MNLGNPALKSGLPSTTLSSLGSTQSAGYGAGVYYSLSVNEALAKLFIWPTLSFLSIFTFSHPVAFQNPQRTRCQGTILVEHPKGMERSLSFDEGTSEVRKAWKWSLTFCQLVLEPRLVVEAASVFPCIKRGYWISETRLQRLRSTIFLNPSGNPVRWVTIY